MSLRPGRAVTAALLLAACATLPAGSAPETAPRTGPGSTVFTPAVRQRMVKDALKVAPPALVRIIRLHPEALVEGLLRGQEYEGQPHHRQARELPGAGAAAALATVGRKAVDALDRHRPMRELAYYLGLAAHFAVDLSDPVLTAPEGGLAAFTPDYGRYVEANLGRYPVVFYGYPDLSTDPPDAAPRVEALEPQGYAAARAARGYFPHLVRAYDDSRGRSDLFDVRSIPFGVASLCYSRGVTNIARAWLQIWRSARGDLTGTPHLLLPDEPGAASRESASAPAAYQGVTESQNASQD